MEKIIQQQDSGMDNKICVLCMSCNQEIFEYQEMVARNTWIKHLKEHNIDVFIYKGSDKTYIDDDVIYCDSEDDLDHTFDKTKEAFSQISSKYDFIVRTNLTTYINPELLIKYCEWLKENNYDIACGDICKNDIGCFVFRGNSFIMTNEVMQYIIDSGYDNKKMLHDDLAISEILFGSKFNVCVCSLRYYKDTIRKQHPNYLHEINKDNLEGIIFISYRIYGEESKPLYRYFELGLAYQIDSIYKTLNNNSIKNDKLIYDLKRSSFIFN